jgi:rRNA-processing protein FCF1
MLPDLLPNQIYDGALAARLSGLALQASSVRSGGAPGPIVERYLSFCAEAVGQLRHALRPSSLDTLLQTRRYWAIVGLDPEGRPARDLVDLELQDCIVRFEAASKSVLDEQKLWVFTGVLVVPDTNIFLHVLTEGIAVSDWRAMARLDAEAVATVVLTLAVIDELDKKKQSDLRTKAKATLKEINSLLVGSTITQLVSNEGSVCLAVLLDEPGHEPFAHADTEIVDRALALRGRSTSKVMILTGDTGMAIRARHAGVDVVLLPTPDPAPKPKAR